MTQIDVMKQALELLQLIWQHGLQQSSITEHETAIKKLSKAIEETEKCQCSLKTKLVGSGCRYCNPQEYIDILEEQIAEAEKVGPINIDWLSNVIRAVDGNNTLGAGELAEKIVAHILLIRGTPQREWDGLTDEEVVKIVDDRTLFEDGYETWCDGTGVAISVEAALKAKNHIAAVGKMVALENENAELIKRLEQTAMALSEQVEINKYLEKKNGATS